MKTENREVIKEKTVPPPLHPPLAFNQSEVRGMSLLFTVDGGSFFSNRKQKVFIREPPPHPHLPTNSMRTAATMAAYPTPLLKNSKTRNVQQREDRRQTFRTATGS